MEDPMEEVFQTKDHAFFFGGGGGIIVEPVKEGGLKMLAGEMDAREWGVRCFNAWPSMNGSIKFLSS